MRGRTASAASLPACCSGLGGMETLAWPLPESSLHKKQNLLGQLMRVSVQPTMLYHGEHIFPFCLWPTAQKKNFFSVSLLQEEKGHLVFLIFAAALQSYEVG